MKYYQHIDNKEVVCEVSNNLARFSKWVWQGDYCRETYKFKELNENFLKSFKEISQREFNLIWGNKLHSA